MWDMEWEFGDVRKWVHWEDLETWQFSMEFGDGCGRDFGRWGFGDVMGIWGHREMWIWGRIWGHWGDLGEFEDGDGIRTLGEFGDMESVWRDSETLGGFGEFEHIS